MKQSRVKRFQGPQFKVGDLVRMKNGEARSGQAQYYATDTNYGRVGIVTKAIGCYDGFVEVLIGTWKGSINKWNIEVIK